MKKILTLMLAAGMSAAAWAQVTVPATLAIPDADAFASWTVIDDNAATSPNTWSYNSGDAQYAEDKKNAANDWLISPAVTLEAGVTYNIDYYVVQRSSYSSDKQMYAITVGDAASVAAQSTILAKNESFSSKLYSKQTCTFIPSATGTYYLGVHVYSKAWMGNFGFQKFEISKATVYPAQITDLTVEAGEAGALSAKLSFTAPSKSNYGGALESLTGVKVMRGTEQIADLPATVGQAMTYTDETLTAAGTYNYSVLAYNADGDAPGTATQVTSPWIGKDTPKAVTNLTGIAAETQVSLTWDAPTEGTHGGYIDPASVTYRITRDGTVIATSWQGELPYVDTVDGLAKYKYTVYPTYDEKEGSSATVTVVAGGAFTIPYSENFDSADSFDFFTSFNPAFSKLWTYNSSKKLAQYWGGTDVDAWLITPSIKMEAGKTYKLSFSTGLENAVSSNNYKNLHVSVGAGTTAEAQGNEIFNEQITSALMATKEVYFTVPNDGSYNVGFRVLGQSSAYAIFLDNILIEESVVTPGVATDLAVQPAAAGALKATVKWTNPAVDKAGNALESISRVDVIRGDFVIASLDAPEVGSQSQIEDEVDAAGNYTYSVVAYLNDAAGDAATVRSPWIGQDTPTGVSELVLADAEGLPYIAWSAPVAGVHGGYINTDALTYRIVRNPDNTVVDDACATVYFTDYSELPLANYSYTVYAADGDLESEGVTSNAVIFGGALELPYVADMTDADHMALWTIVDNNNDGYGWVYKNNELQYTSFKKADDYAFTPPFHTQAGTHKLTYKVKGYSYRYSDEYEVVVASAPVAGNESNLMDADYFEVIESVDANALQSSMYSEREVEYELPVSGIYYIGFHNKSQDSWGVYVGSTKVEITDPKPDPSTSISDIAAGACRYDKATQTIVVDGTASVTVNAVNGMNVLAADNVDGAVSVSHLASGIYVAQVTIAGKLHVIKFVK